MNHIAHSHNIPGQILYADMRIQYKDASDDNWVKAGFVIAQDRHDNGLVRCMCSALPSPLSIYLILDTVQIAYTLSKILALTTPEQLNFIMEKCEAIGCITLAK